MKKKISSKLKILLCFGVIIFTTIGIYPLSVSAHNEQTLGHEPEKVYDLDNSWDADYVGWFTHDPTSNLTTFWRTNSMYVTTYSVPRCYVPADALLVNNYWDQGIDPGVDCVSGSSIDSIYRFPKRQIYTWAVQANATPDNDGTLHVWAQESVRVCQNGRWTGEIKDLKTWSNYFSRTSTFPGHYNKELRIKYQVPGGVTVKYQTLNAGDGYNGRQDILPNASYNYNVGSVHSYAETGIKSHIDWNINNSSKKMVLVGVEVTKDGNSATGTSGLLCSCISDSNRVEVGKSYNLWQDGLGDVGSHANSGYSFNKDRSDIYNFMVGQNFRCTFGTTVTYLYAEVDDICKLYQTMLYDGYDVLNQYGGVSTIHVGQTYNVNSVVPQQSSYKNAVWELVKAGFYKANGSNILTKPTVGVRNEVWGNSSYNFDLSSRSAWNKSVSDANKLYYTPTARDDFEYMGTYQVRAPQIELCYYKDDLGRYHLFSATSGGKALNYSAGLIDQYKRNTWKNNGATTSCTVSSILRNQPVTIDGASQKRNMVLTESYAYSANANNSVKEYNGSTNCWTDTSLPINGVTDSSSRFKAANSQDAYEIAIDKSGNVTRRTTKTTYGTTPTIFVAVYEGGPILTVKSYFTTDKVPNPSRIYYFEAPQSGEFTYGSETLKRGTNVQYPIGTTQVSVATACDQDGLGNADGSLIKKRADGVTVECLRTRFSTTNDLDTVNAVKKLTTTSRINQSGIEGVLPIWGTNWNGVINFKGGVAAMVKLYEADPVKGYWKVAYADLEDGDKEGSLYSQYKNTYYRLGRPKLIELNSATNGDAVQCEFLEHVLVADADNAINGDYTLVNCNASGEYGYGVKYADVTNNNGEGKTETLLEHTLHCVQDHVQWNTIRS